MLDRAGVKLANGAEIFEWHGRACYKYNAKITVSGDCVKLRYYNSGIMCNYPKNQRTLQEKEKAKKEYDEKGREARFEKTGRTAAKRLHGLVGANLHKHRDHRGKKQSFKFITLTFREDVKKLDVANKIFKDFISRLNYHFLAEKGTFLEYVAVPELQMENRRYVWHYHVLFFNLPFIPVAGEMVDRLILKGALKNDYDKRDTLFYIWGQGSVDACRVSFNDSYDVAGYVAKYIGKGLEGVFEYAQEEKLLHKKRFLHSMGLFSPQVMIAFLNKKQRSEIFKIFGTHAKHFKRRGVLGRYFETFSCECDYVGKIFGVDCRSPQKYIQRIQAVFEQYSYGFEY